MSHFTFYVNYVIIYILIFEGGCFTSFLKKHTTELPNINNSKPREGFVATYDLRNSNDFLLLARAISSCTYNNSKSLVIINGIDFNSTKRLRSYLANYCNNNKANFSYVTDSMENFSSPDVDSDLVFLNITKLNLELSKKLLDCYYQHFKNIILVYVSDDDLPKNIGYNSSYSFIISPHSLTLDNLSRKEKMV